MKPTYSKKENKITLSFDYSKDLIEDIKSTLQYQDRKWEPISKSWILTISLTNQRQIQSLLDKYGFFLGNNVSNTVSEESNINSYIEKKSRLNLIKPFQNELEEIYKNTHIRLKPYQVEGFNCMCSWNNMINGDDMGLGKTYQTIFSAEAMGRFPCLLVCPSNVKYQWKEFWEIVNNKRTVSIIESDDKNKDWSADVVIINFDILSGEKTEFINRKGQEDIKVETKYQELRSVKWKYVVFDEIHKLKNYKSLRSKAAQLIVKTIPARHGLTGTLIENKPIELVNPLILINMFNQVFGTWDTFINRYCDAKETRFGMDISGASNTLELNKLLRSTCYIRREKREVLDDLPPIQQSVLDIEISNKKVYKKAEDDFIQYLTENFSKGVVDSARMAEYLVQRNYLRQLSLKGKEKGIVAWLENFQEQSNEKVLIVGNYKESLQNLSIQFDSELIDGSVDAISKREKVKQWAKNKKQFLFGNIAAIGTGTDGLQENCSTMVVLDLPEKPSTLDQLISRIERIGVKNAINIYFLLSKQTIDMKLWESIDMKRKVTEAVNKGVDFKTVNIDDLIVKSYLKK